jgi:hypothetical protein
MTDTPTNTSKPAVTFCSAVSEESGEDPAGSAWSLRRIMLIELPLPWPYNSLESREAPEGLTELLYEVYDTVEQPWGMIGIAPDPGYSVDGMRRIIDLRQGDDVAATYHRDEYLVPPGEVVEHLRRLTFDPGHPAVAGHRLPGSQETRDILVCTHGSIDICCGTFGYPVYKLLRVMADNASTPTRVWRATHFGGHRFAATALDLPEGRYWGHLKAHMLSTFVHRTVPMRDLRKHYRGWAALPEPLLQVAEAAIFAATGWSWKDATVTSVRGDVTAEAGGTLAFCFTHPAGEGEVEVQLIPNGSVQTMDQSKTAELRDAPQYDARITAQRPAGCLDGLASPSHHP